MNSAMLVYIVAGDCYHVPDNRPFETRANAELGSWEHISVKKHTLSFSRKGHFGCLG